jgi:hypothetical protein
MGNGKIENIQDIVYVVPELFDHMKTEDMAKEIEQINTKLMREGKKYILLGPGRWGTRDKFIGIPVVWSQISAAKVIVEIELPNFPLDASLGSHFFHNVTAMNVGYFSVKQISHDDFINWEMLQQFETIEQTRYFKHVKVPSSVGIYMDGSSQKAIIVIEERDEK